MESAILYLTNLIDYNVARDEIIKYIKSKFRKKGEDIVNANIEALSMTESSIKEFKLETTMNNDKTDTLDLYNAMFKREGNNLPVSSFLNMPSGIFRPGTSKLEDKTISELVPHYIPDNCINCNQCAFVCPHSVIRPYLLSSDEYENAPDNIKNRCKKAIGLDDYYFTIGISIKKCTGCGLCINTCPGMKGNKALTFKSLSDEIKNNEQEIFNYLDSNIKDKAKFNELTIKGLEFKKPKFEYCGACAGCGEPAYIKILTQLFGDNLIIANATGCSSIYGGSAPSTPYSIPWASSLFEDNAEYGYGMLISNNLIRNRVKSIMENNMNNSNKELFKEWLENYDNYEVTKKIYDNLDNNIPEELNKLKDYIPSRNYWCVGGDGWANDIGYGGLDHELRKNERVRVLV